MTTSIHPIQLLARTDTEITTILHSVFLIDRNVDESSYNIKRIPSQRARIETIESGLNYFIEDVLIKSKENECFGNFVITTSDATRFFAYWKSFNNNIFVAVSRLPILSFCRRLFELLVFENAKDLNPLMLCLCETPIYPASGLIYEIKLSKGVANINFSNVEQVVDTDSNTIVLNIFNPAMLVAAWEALILEMKVLVVSAVPSILGACCEFLRRLTLPLVSVNTFVPMLPLSLIEAIEAPSPYLLGANINDLVSSQVDLSESVVIDLDARIIYPPVNKSAYPDVKAPDSLVTKLREEINEILLTPLGAWYTRVPTTVPSSDTKSPVSQQIIDDKISRIIEVFLRTNLSLLCSRSCSLRPFYRLNQIQYEQSLSVINNSESNSGNNSAQRSRNPSAECNSSINGLFNEDLLSYFIQHKKKTTSLGFDRKYKTAYGFMQLLREKSNIIQHFIPCWIEMDDLAFAIYEFADDLPLLYIYIKDITTVAQSLLEPEDHVFEITLKNKDTHLFTATDPVSRRLWISFIEEKMMEYQNSDRSIPLIIGTNITNSLNTNQGIAINSNSNNRPLSNNSSNIQINVNSTQSSSHIYPLTPTGMSNYSNHNATANVNVSSSPIAQGIYNSDVYGSRDESNFSNYSESPRYLYRTSILHKLGLGLNRISYLKSTSMYNFEEEDDHRTIQFRYYFMKTQMVSFLRSHIEYSNYEVAFKNHHGSLVHIVQNHLKNEFKTRNRSLTSAGSSIMEESMNTASEMIMENNNEKYENFLKGILWSTGSIINILECISRNDLDEILSNLKTQNVTNHMGGLDKPIDAMNSLNIVEDTPSLDTNQDDENLSSPTVSALSSHSTKRFDSDKSSDNQSTQSSPSLKLTTSSSANSPYLYMSPNTPYDKSPTHNISALRSTSDKTILISNSNFSGYSKNADSQSSMHITGKRNSITTVSETIDLSSNYNNGSPIDQPIINSSKSMSKNRTGLFRYFFKSSKSEKQDEELAPAMDKEQLEEMIRKQEQKETLEQKIHQMKEYVADIISSKKQCEIEIRKQFVEDRLLVLTKLYRVTEQCKTNRSSNCAPLTIHLPVIDIINNSLISNWKGSSTGKEPNSEIVNSLSVPVLTKSNSGRGMSYFGIGNLLSSQTSSLSSTSTSRNSLSLKELSVTKPSVEVTDQTAVESTDLNTQSDVSKIISDVDSYDAMTWYSTIWSALANNCPYGSVSESSSVKPSNETKSIESKISDDATIENSMITSLRSNLIYYLNSLLENAQEQSTDDTKSNDRGKEITSHLIPIYQVQLGYIYQSMDELDKSIACYSKGTLIDQRRLTDCLSQKFNQIIKASNSAGSSPTNAGLLESVATSVTSPASSIQECTPQDIINFIKSSYLHGNIIGLLAYRLSIELLYREAIFKLSTLSNYLEVLISDTSVSVGTPNTLRQSNPRYSGGVAGGSERTGSDISGRDSNSVSPIHNVTIAAVSPQSSLNISDTKKKDSPSDNSTAVRVPINVITSADQYLEDTNRTRHRLLSTEYLNFEWEERQTTSELLNESVVCKSINSTTNAIELSIELLTCLRDMLREYCMSPVYRDSLRWVTSRNFEMKVLPGVLDGLMVSSLFRSFEVQCSQFQKVNVSNMTSNERLVFFCNLYNIITVHGLIVKSSPGVTLLERSSFMRSCKYNVSGMVFSLIDIEHGILRNQSSKPMVFGPLTFSLSFSDRDPRKAYALESPVPNISFGLFTACLSSPILTILRDPQTAESDLKNCGRLFITRNVKINVQMISYLGQEKKIVELPQLFSIYWQDFGKKRKRVLKTVYKLLPENHEVAREISVKLKESETASSNQSDIVFSSYDWTPAVIV